LEEVELISVFHDKTEDISKEGVMRTLVALLLTIALVFGGGMVFAKSVGVSRGGSEMSTDDTSPAADETLEPGEAAPFPTGPQAACNGVNNTIAIADYSSFTSVLTVTLTDVDNEDVLVCNASTQIENSGDGRVAARLRVQDNDGTIFYADPDTSGSAAFIKTTGSGDSFDYRGSTWFVNPSAITGFDFGNVTFTLQLTESPAGAALVSYRALCCQKIQNVPTVDPDGAINVGPQ